MRVKGDAHRRQCDSQDGIQDGGASGPMLLPAARRMRSFRRARGAVVAGLTTEPRRIRLAKIGRQ